MNEDIQNGVKTYIIFGQYGDMNLVAFSQYIVDSADILSYWNHLPLLYVVKTKLGARVLTQKLRPFFDGRSYLVAEIDVKNIDGWMSPGAWEWFITPAPAVKPPTAPPWVAQVLGPPKPPS